MDAAALRRELEITRVRLMDLEAEGGTVEERDALRARLAELQRQLHAAQPTPGTLNPIGRWEALPLHHLPQEDEGEPDEVEGWTAAGQMQTLDLARRKRALDELAGLIDRKSRTKRRRRKVMQVVGDCGGDPVVIRTAAAALASLSRDFRYHEQLGRLLGAPQRAPLPPCPELQQLQEGEAPSLRDGLTAAERTTLEVMRVVAPASRELHPLSQIADDVLEAHPALAPGDVQKAISRLAAVRLPLTELRADRARLSPEGERYIGGQLPVPLLMVNPPPGSSFPPHTPSEALHAAHFCLDHGALDGGQVLRRGLWEHWDRNQQRVIIDGRCSWGWEEQQPTRLVVEHLPPTMTVDQVLAELNRRREAGDFDGLIEVRDESSRTATRIVLECEHLAFVRVISQEVDFSRLLRRSWPTWLKVMSDGVTRTIGLEQLLDAFLLWRSELIVERLSRQQSAHRLEVQNREAVYVAKRLLEPVLEVMRTADEDSQAIHRLMHFMTPEHRAALEDLPFPRTHDYVTGFTELQARHLLNTPRLPTRRIETIVDDWRRAVEREREAGEPLLTRAAIRDELGRELIAARDFFNGPAAGVANGPGAP